jgi:hypothetical protein
MLAIFEEILAILFRIIIHIFLILLALPFLLIIATPFVLIFALFGEGSYFNKIKSGYKGVADFWTRSGANLDSGKP